MLSRQRVHSLERRDGRYYWLLFVLFLLVMGCGTKRAPSPAPPQPAAKQNIIVLLPEPDGKAGRVEVKNAAGSQLLDQPYQALRVERADLSPGAPFIMDAMDVQRLFGPTIDVMPEPEIRFVLYFFENQDALIPESEAQLPAIIAAIRQRRSTAISVTGHTDMTGSSEANYRLGLKRAERVAETLTRQGIDPTSIFVLSHGEADPAVKTPRGIAEQKNRRVEVTVH